MKPLPSFDVALRAVKGGKDPRVFLHLGMLYAQGVGTTQDEVLAQYFIRKALDMGSHEAAQYLYWGYESGARDFGVEIEEAIGDVRNVSPATIAKLRAKVEKERTSGNIGHLSKIRHYLQLFYPEYHQAQAISDILANRHSVAADLLFTLSTTDNRSEVYIDSQDRLLAQLYAPVTTNDQLYRTIVALDDTDLLTPDERDLAQCVVNLTSSYGAVCQKHAVSPCEIYTLDTLCLYPYMKISELAVLRRQGFRALLSIKDVDPVIDQRFMNSLDSDQKLLTICEDIKDQDLQLFLISFVELNISIESLEITSLSLLKAYRNNNVEPLVEHLNDFVCRLETCNIQHDLPFFTADNLPSLDMSM